MRWEHDDFVSGWHRHDQHQLEYALRGSVEVETRDGHHLLPPQQAGGSRPVWSTARRSGGQHRVGVLPRRLGPGRGDRARIPGGRAP